MHKYNPHLLSTTDRPKKILPTQTNGTSLDKHDNRIFRSAVGGLLHAAVSERINLAYRAEIMGWKLHAPNKIHMNLANRVMSFFYGTIDYALYFTAKTEK